MPFLILLFVVAWPDRVNVGFAKLRMLRFRPATGFLRITGMMKCYTCMPKTKVALTLESALLEQVDHLVARRRFRNRSQAVEAALADKVQRLARTRLAR